jgi:serine/threonine-protein kinase
MTHENIVDVYDVGLSGDWYYYSMEALPRVSLYDVVRKRGPFGAKDLVELALQLASALAYMHGEGYMHRDVKPDNVLFADRDRVKLIDFGLACAADDTRLTREGSFIGTPGYVAPENVREYRDPEPASDIYSLGATLYFAGAGRPPFSGKGGATEKLSAQVAEDPVPLRAVNPEIPPELSRVIEKMMSRDPAKRYGYMKQIVRELEALRDRAAAPLV